MGTPIDQINESIVVVFTYLVSLFKAAYRFLYLSLERILINSQNVLGRLSNLQKQIYDRTGKEPFLWLISTYQNPDGVYLSVCNSVRFILVL